MAKTDNLNLWNHKDFFSWEIVICVLAFSSVNFDKSGSWLKKVYIKCVILNYKVKLGDKERFDKEQIGVK